MNKRLLLQVLLKRSSFPRSHALRGNVVAPRCGAKRGAFKLHSHAARGNELMNFFVEDYPQFTQHVVHR